MAFDAGTSLVRYDAACRALAEAKAVDEVKDLRDKAEAMRIYAQQAKNKTLEVDAAEIRLRAERRLGEMIAAQKAGDGLAKPGPKSVVADDRIPTLAETGISKDLSSRAQKLAAVPDDEFEEQVGEWRDRVQAEGERVTTKLVQAGERAMAGKAKPAKVDPDEVETLRAENTELRQRVVELGAQLEEAVEENVSLARVAEADDKCAASLAEAKRYREQNRILSSRIDGLMNEKNAMLRSAKSWQRKAEKAGAGIPKANGAHA